MKRIVTTEEFVKAVLGNEDAMSGLYQAAVSIATIRKAGVDFSETDLTQVDFSDPHLRPKARGSNQTFGYAGAGLCGANFTGAIFPEGADLSGYRLYGAVLDGVKAIGVNFQDANLRFASTRGADFSGSNIKAAFFGREPEHPAIDLAGATVTEDISPIVQKMVDAAAAAERAKAAHGR